MLVRDPEVLAPGATAQTDAVLLKSEETEGLHEVLKALSRPRALAKPTLCRSIRSS
jgi:hypothetical protein